MRETIRVEINICDSLFFFVELYKLRLRSPLASMLPLYLAHSYIMSVPFFHCNVLIYLLCIPHSLIVLIISFIVLERVYGPDLL